MFTVVIFISVMHAKGTLQGKSSGFFRICFSNLRQKDYLKPIIGRDILLFALWGFDGIKHYAIIYKTNHGPALHSLGIKKVYEFPRDAQYLKKKNKIPKMFSLTATLGYTFWKKSINHSELIALNRHLIHLPLKSLDRILKQKKKTNMPLTLYVYQNLYLKKQKQKQKEKMKQNQKAPQNQSS